MMSAEWSRLGSVSVGSKDTPALEGWKGPLAKYELRSGCPPLAYELLSLPEVLLAY